MTGPACCIPSVVVAEDSSVGALAEGVDGSSSAVVTDGSFAVEKGCIPSAGAAEVSSAGALTEGVVESSSADVTVADGSPAVSEEVVVVEKGSIPSVQEIENNRITNER